jgi:manganese/zinc/iron transport system permease protein
MAQWFNQLDAETIIALWTILISVLVNVSCALLGCYLVLRRMSLMGDAISHAILPGLVVAFLMAGSRASLPMLAGAMAMGLATTLLSQALHRFARIGQDVAMAVVFTALFALGVILIARVADSVDLDPGCVLYGLVEFVSIETFPLGGIDVPVSLPTLTGVLAANLAFIGLLYKELKLSAFDAPLATSMGLSATWVHYLLMAMVAATTVAAFEAVGSILVIAMLIVPGAAAHLLTDRMGRMLAIAAGIGAAAAVLGYLAALWLNTSLAGMMAVVAGGLYLLALLAGPRHGLVSKAAGHLRLSMRICREDVLGMLYRWQEARGQTPLPVEHVRKALGGLASPTLAVWQLRAGGLVRRAAGGLLLADAGRRRAEGLVRGHRLWEAYLARFLNLPADHLHESAARVEHYLGKDLQRELTERLEHPAADPHGRQIPADGVPPDGFDATSSQ